MAVRDALLLGLGKDVHGVERVGIKLNEASQHENRKKRKNFHQDLSSLPAIPQHPMEQRMDKTLLRFVAPQESENDSHHNC